MATCSVTNYGTVAWSSGTLRGGACGGGTLIYNYGLWDSQGDLIFNDDYGCNGAIINNYGTFYKSVGSVTNSTQIRSGVTFNNTGNLNVQSGTLSLQGGANFTGGTTANSTGTIQLALGGYNINGTTTRTNVQLVSGVLAGNNLLSGGFTWVGGNWDNSEVTIATNTLVLIVGGVGLNDFYTCLVTNFGAVEWSSGTLRGGGCSGGTAVYNYGLWDSQGVLGFNDAFGCNDSVFNNYGTLRKSVGSFGNSTQIQAGVTLNNAGILDVRSGTLSLQGGGSFTGGVATNNAGIIQLAAGGYNINGTTTGVNVQEVGGNLVGTNTLSGGFTWVSGFWNGSTVTIATNCVLGIAGTTLNDFATCTVTNLGTVAWSSGTIRGGGCGGGTVIYNYGLWDSQGDLVFNDAFACNGVLFNNFGTLAKSQGTNTTLLDAGVTFLNAGTIDAFTGLLQFGTTPAFTSGNLRFGIGGTTNFGQITVPGTVSLGGAASAVLLNGFVPSLGSQFVVFNYGSTNGTFTDYTVLNVGSGVAFTPSLSATALTLTTVATNFTAAGPIIITQPASRTVNYGDTVMFQVGVSGSPTLVYQWRQNNIPVPGATSATLILTNVVFTQAGAYTVAVSNSISGVVSQPAQLTVNAVLPSITGQPPGSITVPQGSNAVISVTVAGEPPPILQWQFNGNNLTDGGRISGSSTTTLTISNVQPFDAGNYSDHRRQWIWHGGQFHNGAARKLSRSRGGGHYAADQCRHRPVCAHRFYHHQHRQRHRRRTLV